MHQEELVGAQIDVDLPHDEESTSEEEDQCAMASSSCGVEFAGRMGNDNNAVMVEEKNGNGIGVY